jgi:hypothetical protein
MTNAHKQNVLLSSLSEQQADEHIELTIWEAGFDVDPATDVWHYSRPDDDTCIIINRSPWTLVVSIGDAVVEVPVTVTVGDEEWLLSRNHIDALIDMHMQVLRQSMRGEA